MALNCTHDFGDKLLGNRVGYFFCTLAIGLLLVGLQGGNTHRYLVHILSHETRFANFRKQVIADKILRPVLLYVLLVREGVASELGKGKYVRLRFLPSGVCEDVKNDVIYSLQIHG